VKVYVPDGHTLTHVLAYAFFCWQLEQTDWGAGPNTTYERTKSEAAPSWLILKMKLLSILDVKANEEPALILTRPCKMKLDEWILLLISWCYDPLNAVLDITPP
jgi:hypothetical protein